MTRNHNAMLEWADQNERYMRGWYVGSQDDNGEHLREPSLGWPYSIYRMGAQLGVSDMVLCDGIQARQDADDLMQMLNERAGIL